jgi:hypothetical protein
LASLRDPKETRIITERLILTLAGSKGDLIDEFNNEGKNAKWNCSTLFHRVVITNYHGIIKQLKNFIDPRCYFSNPK